MVGSAFDLLKGEYPDKEFVFSNSKLCNLTDFPAVVKHVESCRPDAIIHLAAVCGGVGLSMKYPATLLRDNVLMNINVLEAARLCGVKKTVMSLSTGMYPADAPNPILEEYIHNGYPHPSNYGYSFAKRLIDPAIKAYRAEYNLRVIGLIPNGIFGERNDYRYEYSTMLPALIRRFYENREGHSMLTVWGDGAPLREYTYANDFVRAYMWCLENYDDERIMHVGSTEEHSVKEIAYMVAEFLGIDKDRIEFDTSKPGGQLKKSTDNSKFVRLSNFKYTPFRTGLERTITWFRKYYGDPAKVRC